MQQKEGKLTRRGHNIKKRTLFKRECRKCGGIYTPLGKFQTMCEPCLGPHATSRLHNLYKKRIDNEKT